MFLRYNFKYCKLHRCLFLPLILLSSFTCFSQHVSEPLISFKGKDSYELVTKNVLYFQDPTNEVQFEDIRNQKFSLSDAPVLNFGSSDASIWLKLNIFNASNQSRFILEIDNPLLTTVAVFAPDSEGNYKRREISKNERFDSREIHNTNSEFELVQTPGTTATYFVRVKSYTQLLIPVRVGSKEGARFADLDKSLLSGLYFGIMFVMFFYNLFIFLSVRDRSYLFYILYILSVTLVQVNVTGFGFKYLWPDYPEIEKFGLFLFPTLTAFTSILFIRDFLMTNSLTAWSDKVFLVFIASYLFTLINAIFGDKATSYSLLNINALPLALFMIGLAAHIRIKFKYRPATFFLISWTIFLVGIVVFVLKDYNIVPYNLFTFSSIQLGSEIEVVLLSIALADRINVLTREKEVSQAQALKVLEENERITREQNIILESKVKERTIELEASNVELAKTLDDLKEKETQLVESEKMASLGQLTAGIAHEINNPINYVTSNVNPLRRDIAILMDIIQEIEELTVNGVADEERREKIESLKNELDYEYLKTEIDYLLKGISEGASRTAEIVKGLRVFSRLDEDDLKKADINEGLSSSLVIVNHLLNSVIEVEKNYSGIPMVECYPGKLNQVFLNIMSNAIHAIHKRWNGETGGKLSLKTWNDENHVYISISDNGTGMDETTRRKLFEPFFTTKDVGEGTGLGMSIAYNTVKKHNGQIQINSELGEGTEFIISLPINQS